MASRILVAAVIVLAIDCDLLECWSLQMPPPAATNIETPQVMEDGDDGVPFPFHALFLGLLAGAGATVALLTDAGFRLGAALHRRSARRSPDDATAQPNAARSHDPEGWS